MVYWAQENFEPAGQELLLAMGRLVPWLERWLDAERIFLTFVLLQWLQFTS